MRKLRVKTGNLVYMDGVFSSGKNLFWEKYKKIIKKSISAALVII